MTKKETRIKGRYLLMVNCPKNQSTIQGIVNAASEKGAGVVDNYDRVAMILSGTETWKSGTDSHPTIGIPGEISSESSVTIFMRCRKRKVEKIIKAVVAAHPYEVPVVNVFKLKKTGIIARTIEKTKNLKPGHQHI